MSHLITMREKMTKIMELVKENVTQVQVRQKHWYDQKACHWGFQEGDQVLVLLPTSANKLLSCWQGLYQVLNRVGQDNYQINMHDHRKRQQNLPREYATEVQFPRSGRVFRGSSRH